MGPYYGHVSQSRALELACALLRSSCCTCGLAFASLTAFVAALPTAEVSNCCCRAAACRSNRTHRERKPCSTQRAPEPPTCLCDRQHARNSLPLLRVPAPQRLPVCPSFAAWLVALPRPAGHCRVQQCPRACCTAFWNHEAHEVQCQHGRDLHVFGVLASLVLQQTTAIAHFSAVLQMDPSPHGSSGASTTDLTVPE